ncbi:MAG: DUF151 domain-containing protein [Bacteroidales bacterium]
MKRIRLDIGALTASASDGGNFMFFLYREGMDLCLPVPLTPPDMHAILANFQKLSSDGVSVQDVFYSTLQEFRVELLEVTVIRDEEDEKFLANLLFFDGEKEVLKGASFVDGLILAKNFGCPIYILEELMDKYSTTMDLFSNEIVKTESRLVRLKEEFKEAVSKEDYETAAVLSKEITRYEAGNTGSAESSRDKKK